MGRMSPYVFMLVTLVLVFCLYLVYVIFTPDVVEYLEIYTPEPQVKGDDREKLAVGMSSHRQIVAIDLNKSEFRYISKPYRKITEMDLTLPEGLRIISLNPVDNPINYDDNLKDAEEKFVQYSEERNIECTKQIRLGLKTDGGWNMCIAGIYEPRMFDCIVYSFGIFYMEFLHYYKGGKGETAWVGSLVPGVTLTVGK